MGIAVGENGPKELGASKGGLETVNIIEESYNHIMSLLDPNKPLFSIRDTWPGPDSIMLSAINVARGNSPVEAVRPQDLEVRPDASSPTGFALWNKAIDVHLEQCIIPEELPEMVSRGILTAEEADVVASGIIQIINPGSKDMHNLLQESKSDPSVRNNYIYKPYRDRMGKGIKLSKNLMQEAWLKRLEKLANLDVPRPYDNAAVIQRLVEHNWYDMVRHEVPGDDGKPSKFHLIGAMFMLQNRNFYPSTWRVGLETHLGITADKPGLVLAMVRQPDWPIGDDQEEEE
ncbi:hypothetical protein Focb16_v003134 [Fusarium oxysporum f. sp. cubense]|uniref:Uncharacterized protein n=1 Tax=Fusarium oxysporum f. sp. cubense TaxID=61366 RepID=A0A559L6H2_FUSOC|nr:hypothetical protein Focb16_v003134 [Fusarium oxysporum f. sp. cubense]